MHWKGNFRHFWQANAANRQSIPHNDIIKWMQARAAWRQKEFEPLEHCTACDAKRSLRRRNHNKPTVYAMKRKWNVSRIILRERLLWQESKVKTYRQQLCRTSMIWGKLKMRDRQPESPKKCFRRYWMISETVWAILRVLRLRKMRNMRMIKIQSWASWAKMTNPAGWWAQSPEWYCSTWTGFGRSRSSLPNWRNRDGAMQPTTTVKEIRSTARPVWEFRPSLRRRRILLQPHPQPQHLASLWRLLISSPQYPTNSKGLHDEGIVISG